MTDIQSARLTIGQGLSSPSGHVVPESPSRPAPRRSTVDRVTISEQAKSRLQSEGRPLDAELVELPAEHLAVRIYREASSRMASMTLARMDADEGAIEGEFTVEFGSTPNEVTAFLHAEQPPRAATRAAAALISDGADVYSPPPPPAEADGHARNVLLARPVPPDSSDPVRTYQAMAGAVDESRPSRGVFFDAWS